MSTSTGRGKAVGCLAVLAIVLLAGYILLRPAKESLETAIAGGYVGVAVSAPDETKAVFTFRASGAAPRNLVIAIPAGTVLRNADAGGQWLMTARSAVALVDNGTKWAEVVVPTYCLHQFDEPPNRTSTLSIEPETSGGGDGDSGTLSPARALARCLDEHFATDPFGIWLVSDGWLDMDYATVRATLQQRFREQYDRRNPGDHNQGIRSRLQERFPRLSDERLDEEIRKYDAAHPDNLDERMATATDQALQHFLHTQYSLGECVPNFAARRFFTTSRGSHS
jgi:hypothetical protein